MSNEVTTVGDLCGKHVGTDTVRIEEGNSVIEGVITSLTFSAQYELALSGEKYYTTLAYISIGQRYELNDISLGTPASIVTRSDPQWHSGTPDRF